jgi:hypothetical protein
MCNVKGNNKAIPLQAWTSPEGSRKLRLPVFKTHEGCKVSPTHRPPLPLSKYVFLVLIGGGAVG